MFTGLNMQFKNGALFIVCMNVVPTNKNKSNWSEEFSKETSPHNLCHYKKNMIMIQEHHNNIVEKIRKAVQFGQVNVDQQIAGLNDECRLDIVITNGRYVSVIDVTCPFENSKSALAKADYVKVMKYQHVKAHFEATGKKCDV